MIPSVKRMQIDQLVEEAGPELIGEVEGMIRKAFLLRTREVTFSVAPLPHLLRQFESLTQLLAIQGYTVTATGNYPNEWRVTWP